MELGPELFRFVSIERITDVEYIGFDHKTYSHCCDDMKSGYEAGFCNGDLFLLTVNDEMAKDYWRVKGYGGWSYACSRHFAKLLFAFALALEERYLDGEFDKWEDEQREIEKQLPLG